MLISLAFVAYSDPHPHVCHYSGQVQGLTSFTLVARMSGSLFRTRGCTEAVYTRADERLNTGFSFSIDRRFLDEGL